MNPIDLDRVFGRSRLRMVTGAHVEVFREEAGPGERRRYTKRFLATPDGDFRLWTEREWRILARLVGHGVAHVPEVVQFDRGAPGRPALVQTYDAGVTVDHWATLLPVARDGVLHAHVFEDCAHWWALARHALAALEALHALDVVHLDLKADNVCIPYTPPELDPRAEPHATLAPRFEQLALIDFAFSLVSGEPLEQALPIARQPDYLYQSPRLLRALEAGARGDLAPTQALDWRCDLYSLAAMLRRYLPDPELAPHGDWTPARLAQARALVRELIAAHDAAASAQRPHRRWIEAIDGRLADAALVRALERGWTLASVVDPAREASPTPITRIALPVPRERRSPNAAGHRTPAFGDMGEGVLGHGERAQDGAHVHGERGASGALGDRERAETPAFGPDDAIRPTPWSPPPLAAEPASRPAPVRRSSRSPWAVAAALAVVAVAVAAPFAHEAWRTAQAERTFASALGKGAAHAPALGSGAMRAPGDAVKRASIPEAASSVAAQVPASAPGIVAAASAAPAPMVVQPSPLPSAVVAQANPPPASMAAQPSSPPASILTSKPPEPVASPHVAASSEKAPHVAVDAPPPPTVAPRRRAEPAPTLKVATDTPRASRVPHASSARAAGAPTTRVAAARAGAASHTRTPVHMAHANTGRSARTLMSMSGASGALRPLASPARSPDPVAPATKQALPPRILAMLASAQSGVTSGTKGSGGMVSPTPSNATVPSAVAAAPPSPVPFPASPPATVQPTAYEPPIDYGARARDVLVAHLPRTAQHAERLVARALFIADHLDDGSQLREVQHAADAVRLGAQDPLAAIPVASGEARSLADAARAAWARRNVSEAIALQTRALGANPRDASVAGQLAWLHLHQRGGDPSAARSLALHALSLHDGAHPGGRFDDWVTLATANALLGRERDARAAWFVALALAPGSDRACRAAMDAYATWGERLRDSTEALVYRAHQWNPGLRASACEWPPRRMASSGER